MVNDIQETHLDRLAKLGFKAASDRAIKLKEKARKLAIAYEHFRYVRPENINEFNVKASKKGLYLAFKAIADYEGIPPESVLMAHEAAIEKKCFDSFEIAYMDKVRDPILFGRINDCPDRFFIAEWDDDVKITDLLAPNEG